MANYNLLKIFVCVAEEGNITKASEKLFISQPAVTKSIKQLEEEMQGELFVRKNKGVVLTNEGKHIYDKVVKILSELENVYMYCPNTKKLESGILRLGTTTSNITLLISKQLNSFLKKYPNLDINVRRGEENELTSLLINDEMDLAVMDSEFVRPELEIIQKYSVNYAVVGSKEIMEKYKDKPMTKQEFAQSNLALISSGKTSRQNIDNYFAAFGIRLDAKYELESYSLIYELIKQGVAVGVVNPQYFRNEIERQKIYVINTDFKIDSRIICLVGHKNAKNNHIKDEFIQFLEETI